MVSGSLLASWLVTVAVSSWFVVGDAGVTVTVSTTGGELAGGETDQVRVSVAVRVPSLTVTTTLCVPAGAVRVPLMTPVAGAIVTPAGRSVAL